jgi:hypothetical protein
MDRAVYDRTIQMLRAAYPRIPGALRYLPAYSDAQRGLSGHQTPGRYGRLVERVVLSALRQTDA